MLNIRNFPVLCDHLKGIDSDKKLFSFFSLQFVGTYDFGVGGTFGFTSTVLPGTFTISNQQVTSSGNLNQCALLIKWYKTKGQLTPFSPKQKHKKY